MLKKLGYTILFSCTILAQMVPHPKLLEKIQSGKIELPYALRVQSELSKRGVDIAWADEKLKENKLVLNNDTVLRQFGPAKPLSSTFNALVLLVEFSDNPQQVSTSYFDDLIFEDSFSSMRGFFQEVSYGELDIVTSDLPSTIGWVTAPQSYSYYVDGQNGFGTFPQNTQGLARDVVQIVDSLIDFSIYDNDGDGEAEAIFIVFTGPGAEFSGSDDDIWSHAWAIPGGYLTDDGVTVFRYSVQPEYWQTPGDMTIGVYAHEAGHSVFGLPDLYDLDYSSYGTGNWSLMSGGSWNGFSAVGGDSPAWPDAWSHIQMGYASASNVTSDLIAEEIIAASVEPDIYKLWDSGNGGTEYFLVQNRQQVGYDSALPGSGLLIWHVDETEPTNSNEWYPTRTDSGHYKIALEQADGDYGLEKAKNAGDAADPFPGTLSRTLFSTLSTPNSDAYDGSASNVTVENISSSGPIMTVDLLVNEPTASLELTSPNGGETWSGGSFQKVEWTSTLIDNIKIELSIDGGSSWIVLSENFDASLGEYEWQIPNTTSANCLIKITDTMDGLLTDQSDSPFTISAVAQIMLVSPNGGETWQGGTLQKIQWNSTAVTEVTIELSINGGIDWTEVISGFEADSGEYEWTVPNTPSSSCLVRISSRITGGGIISDQSDAAFAISPGPMLEVLSPNGDEVWEVNSTQLIEWSSSAITSVNIELSIDGGSSWSVVKENLTASIGEYNWSVPDSPSLNSLIKIYNSSDSSLSDQSDNLFTIAEEPDLLLEIPNGGEDYTVGETHEITWNSVNVALVKIEYSTSGGGDWLSISSSTESDESFAWSIPSTPSDNCVVKITDLSNSENYDVSDESFSISPITPNAPILVTPAENDTNIEMPIIFSWEGVGGAVSYDFQLAYDESFSSIVHDLSNIGALSTELSSLIEGMKFYWRVKANGLEEDSPYSDVYSFITILTPPSQLELTHSSNEPLRINLNWTDNSNGETGYFIERAELEMDWMLHDLVDANETYWWEAAFNPQNYSYRVKAKSDFTESGYSNVVSMLISDLERGDQIPVEYSLDQNYPNPFNPSTKIRFGLPYRSNVKLKIYNILGEVVDQLVNKELEKGYHNYDWNASDISSGVYFYYLEAHAVTGDQNFQSIRKMMFVK